MATTNVMQQQNYPYLNEGLIMKKTYRALCFMLIVAFLLSAFLVPVKSTAAGNEVSESGIGENASESKGNPEYKTFDDLNGKKVAMLTGAPFEELVRSKAPGVAEFSYYNSLPDLVLALKSGKIDAFLTNNAIAMLAVNRNPELALFPENLSDGVFGFAFAKGTSELSKWQAAYDSIPKETVQKLWEKWTGADDSIKSVPEQDWPGKNGTVEAAVADTLEPMSYVGNNGKLIGFDIELLLLMAKELDVHINFNGMEFSAILSSVQAGKATVGAGSIIATEERRHSVDFIDYYPAAFSLVVRSNGTSAGKAPDSEDIADTFRVDKAAILTGTMFSDSLLKVYPDAELMYFNNDADMINAVIGGKVDAVVFDEPVAIYATTMNDDITIYPKKLEPLDYGFIFSKDQKGQELCNEFNEFLKSIKNDGTLDELEKKWLSGQNVENVEMTDYRKLPATKGTINFGSIQTPPFLLWRGDMLCGFEAEIIALFCKDNGYALKPVEMNFDAILSSVQTGKCDICGGCIAKTDERKENVLFSDTYYAGGVVLVVSKDELEKANKDDFFTSLIDSFQKTFIREQRWKLFVEGILRTLLISVSSIFLGTVLGFIVFLLCRNGNPFANYITRFCIWLIQGMPMVVLLMILYYIIFAKSTISGTLVSIIGFTMVFGASVFGMLKSGVGAVDSGQTEAAYALGYTDWATFFKIILPQALPHFMPAFKGEVTSTIKATAIVGYVAVQDLTKMGDIVRSRTYDAFFPLIAVAIVYFILAGILKFIIGRIEILINPRLRSKDTILNGVKKDD
nr:ABC transporter permease subunit [Butyrivibrio sp. WCE2006]